MLPFINIPQDEYDVIKTRVELWEAGLRRKFGNGWISYPSHQGPILAAEFGCDREPSNDDHGIVEQYETLANPPAKVFAYVSANHSLTIWTGGKLCNRAELGPVYRDSFGGKRRSVRATFINGVEYFGTYYTSAGDYCRLRITAESARKLAS